jgi:hypothetical protein
MNFKRERYDYRRTQTVEMMCVRGMGDGHGLDIDDSMATVVVNGNVFNIKSKGCGVKTQVPETKCKQECG